MAILNYTTTIDADKTIGEIEKLLIKRGATKVIKDYEAGLPSAISFGLMMGEKMTYFTLPTNYAGMLKAMRNDSDIPNSYCNQPQAVRTAWRVIKAWILAQMAIIDAGLAELPEVFLPYAVTATGTTLYKELKENRSNLLSE